MTASSKFDARAYNKKRNLALSFTRTQRYILLAMLEHDDLAACFFGGTRDPVRHWTDEWRIYFKAYMSPEFFLEARGVIAQLSTNENLPKYTLTDIGRECAQRMRGLAQ